MGASDGDSPIRLLVVEDDMTLLDLLSIALSRDGFTIIPAASGKEALQRVRESRPDAIYLDVLLPDMNGFALCHQLRSLTRAPILVVTALGKTEDLLRGLEAGGDDYIVKPFVYQELLARLLTCVNRMGDKGGRLKVADLRDGDLEVNGRRVMTDGRSADLTSRELDLLLFMKRNPGRVLSKEAILANVWGPRYSGDDSLVKQYIYRLRQKLECDPSNPTLILTVRGDGYVFEPAS